MHRQDAIHLDQLCPKISKKVERITIKSLNINVFIVVNHQNHLITFTQYQKEEKQTSNCVPCCLSCNGKKSDSEVLSWYRKQNYYDPRRAMAAR